MGQLPSPEWTANKLRSDGSDGIGGAYLCSVFCARRLFDFRSATHHPATPPHHDTALSCHCLVVIGCLHSCRLSGTDVNPTFAAAEHGGYIIGEKLHSLVPSYTVPQQRVHTWQWHGSAKCETRKHRGYLHFFIFEGNGSQWRHTTGGKSLQLTTNNVIMTVLSKM
jgi:hypothetical protein